MNAPPIAPRIPGYRDLAPLGRGGYSEVFQGYQEQFDRWVAVKVLTFKLGDDRTQRRFLRECRLAGRLSTHPNIVTVYDAGISPDGQPYIAMELFPQGSLTSALATKGPFDVAEALRIGVALAGALETAHRAGVVHRDVKPANVLLATYGQPVLADFGLSVVSERLDVASNTNDAFTPYHAAPEVLERAASTAASDVYSLASTLYTILSGRAPHQDDGDRSIAALMARITQREAPPLPRPDLPPPLTQVVHAALARDPGVRPRSALAFAMALQDAQRMLGHEPTEPVVMDVPPPAPDVAMDLTDPVGMPAVSIPGSPGSSPSPISPPAPPAPPAPASPAPSPASSQDPPWPSPGASPRPPGPPPAPVAAPAPASPGVASLSGDMTVERERLGAAQPAPKPLPPPQPPESNRAGVFVVVALMTLLGLALGIGALLLTGGDDDETSSDDDAPPQLDLEVPTGLTAVESPAGVQLDWEGDDGARYVVLTLSEAEQPIPTNVQGTSELIEATELEPDVGYCFTVAYAASLQVASDAGATEAAFSPPTCIRGAAEDTVLQELQGLTFTGRGR